MADEQKFFWGTGRRKTAVARVRLREGSGQILINGKAVEDYFSEDAYRSAVYAPVEVTQTRGSVDVFVQLDGGGIAGQAGATMLGIARALKSFNRDHEAALRHHGFLTRDSRMKERKKYGQKGARKRFQFSKR